MKKTYVKPTFSLFVFEAEDICTASQTTCFKDIWHHDIDAGEEGCWIESGTYTTYDF